MSTPLIHQHHLDGRAAAALRRSARVPKHYQRALGYTCRSTVSRHMSGEMPSEFTRSLRFVDALARGYGTSPWPFIAEHMVVALQGDIRLQDTRALEARLEELTDLAFTLATNAYRMARHGHRQDQAEADTRAAEAMLERAAIQRELAEREERR